MILIDIAISLEKWKKGYDSIRKVTRYILKRPEGTRDFKDTLIGLGIEAAGGCSVLRGQLKEWNFRSDIDRRCKDVLNRATVRGNLPSDKQLLSELDSAIEDSVWRARNG